MRSIGIRTASSIGAKNLPAAKQSKVPWPRRSLRKNGGSCSRIATRGRSESEQRGKARGLTTKAQRTQREGRGLLLRHLRPPQFNLSLAAFADFQLVHGDR